VIANILESKVIQEIRKRINTTGEASVWEKRRERGSRVLGRERGEV